MRLSPSQTLNLRDGVADLTDQASRDLGVVWRSVKHAVDAGEALNDILPALIDAYGQAAAAMAAEWYDDLRAKVAPKGTFRADPADISDVGVPALVGWAIQTAVGTEPGQTRDEAFKTLIRGGMQRRIANFSRATITTAAVADPGAHGWQRVGTGECDFCLMLIERGAVYSEATADFGAHDHCRCSAVPAFDGAKPIRVRDYVSTARNISDADRARVREWIADHWLTARTARGTARNERPSHRNGRTPMSEAAPEATKPTPAAPNPPAAPPASTPATPPAANSDDPVQLPDDHPLVKAYNAQKDQIKTLKSAQIDPDELKRLRELEEASKTEAQKQAEELERLRKENEGYKTAEQIAEWAKEVSKETDVPAGLLRGSTKEELEAHAAQIKPLIGQEQTQQQVVPTIGKQPAVQPNIPIAQQIAAAEQVRDQHPANSAEWKAAQQTVMSLKGMQLAEVAGNHVTKPA